MSNTNNSNFQALQAKWYAKAKKSGFDDIEDSNGHLRVRSKKRANDVAHYVKDHAEYFRMAAQFMHVYRFPDTKYRAVWQLHIDGLSIRETSLKMRIGKISVQFRMKKLKQAFFEWMDHSNESKD